MTSTSPKTVVRTPDQHNAQALTPRQAKARKVAIMDAHSDRRAKYGRYPEITRIVGASGGSSPPTWNVVRDDRSGFASPGNEDHNISALYLTFT